MSIGYGRLPGGELRELPEDQRVDECGESRLEDRPDSADVRLLGWQRQASGTSVQGVLEKAAAALDERAVTVIGAGRTDAGVHALGQVAAFTLVRTISAPRSCAP